MSHYEERLEQDLGAIRAGIEEVTESVDKALHDAIHAILVGDRALASATILGDMPINRKVRELDALCHAFVAQHLPSAGHLRFVSSALRMNVALERIGDYAVTLSREEAQLSTRPPESVARDIELVGEQVCVMFRQATRAFNEANPELARGTLGMAAQIDSTSTKVFADLLQEGEKGSRPIKDLFGLLVILNRLDRVADQSKNICEEALFVATGETKEPKVYRLLFIDQRNDALSQMAAAYAARAFPESGRYKSAGWAAAEKLDPRFKVYLEGRGFDLGGIRPVALSSLRDELDDTHVIVSLGAGARDHIGELPFHTVLLEWDLGVDPAEFAALDQDRAEATLDRAFKQLSVEIRDLMEILRGKGAA